MIFVERALATLKALRWMVRQDELNFMIVDDPNVCMNSICMCERIYATNCNRGRAPGRRRLSRYTKIDWGDFTWNTMPI